MQVKLLVDSGNTLRSWWSVVAATIEAETRLCFATSYSGVWSSRKTSIAGHN